MSGAMNGGRGSDGRSPHPATVAQGKVSHPARAARGDGRPPHPATVAQAKASHPARAAQAEGWAPHPATVVVQAKVPHPATVAQAKVPHPARVAQAEGRAPHPATVVVQAKVPHPAMAGSGSSRAAAGNPSGVPGIQGKVVQGSTVTAPHFSGNTPTNNSTITATVRFTQAKKLGRLYGPFEVEAEDLNANIGIKAEYRQEVKGWYKVDGNLLTEKTGSDKSGPTLTTSWQEDGTKNNGAYGYRDDMDNLSYYYGSSKSQSDKSGANFYGKDTPGVETTKKSEKEMEFELSFRGSLIDPNNTSTVYEQREWKVKGHAKKNGDDDDWSDI